MTRLFYGSTVLAGLCAMTLIVGCGGSSTPTVTCDGGNCGDAKRDTGAKLDGTPAKLDGAPLDTPAPKLDGPAPKLDGPAPIVDGPPAVTPDGPPAVTPDGPPAVTPDGPPAVTPDGPPAVTPDGPPAVTPDGPPAVIPDGPPAKLDGSAPNLDGPAPKLDGPPANLDGPPANLDGPPANLDGNVVIDADAAAEAGTDGNVAIIDADAAAEAGPDGNVAIIDADAAAEAGPDGNVVVIGDAAEAGVADAPESDTPVGPGIDGGLSEVGDGGGVCNGDAGCHAYSFQGDNPDAGLPTGFTTAGGTGTWDLVMDGSNIVLEGTYISGGTSFAQANLPPADTTDETIQVKVRFTNVSGGNSVRICGRFTLASTNAYCLEISTQAGDAGSTNGTMTIDQRLGGAPLSTLATPATNLDIMVGEWHTYGFSIVSSLGPAVGLSGFMDGALKVSAADAPPQHTNGTVALGVVNATADFDDLIVTTP